MNTSARKLPLLDLLYQQDPEAVHQKQARQPQDLPSLHSPVATTSDSAPASAGGSRAICLDSWLLTSVSPDSHCCFTGFFHPVTAAEHSCKQKKITHDHVNTHEHS